MTQKFNSDKINVGVEAELTEVDPNGEPTAEAFQNHNHYQRRLRGWKLAHEAVKGVVEVNFADKTPASQIRRSMDELSNLIARPTRGSRLAPIASSYLRPWLVNDDGSKFEPGIRQSTPNPVPTHAKVLRDLAPNQQIDHLAVCGMHVHVSVGEMSNDQAVVLAGQMANFQAFLAALSARSPFDNRKFTKIASNRWLNFSALKGSTIIDYPETEADYKRAIEEAFLMNGTVKPGSKGLEMIRKNYGRIYLPTRASNFGTSETRTLDMPRSKTEAALWPLWIVGLAGRVTTDPNSIGKISATNQARLMTTASYDGMSSANKHMWNPVTRELKPVNQVIRQMMKYASGPLKELELWTQFESDMNDFLERGSGALREWQDFEQIHSKLREMGDPASTYDIEEVRQGHRDISEREARALNLYAVQGYSFDLSYEGQVARQDNLEQTVWPILEIELGLRTELPPLSLSRSRFL